MTAQRLVIGSIGMEPVLSITRRVVMRVSPTTIAHLSGCGAYSA